jgi:hypothetical protein
MFVKFMCTIITILLFSVSTFYANKKIRKKGIRFVVSVMLFFISAIVVSYGCTAFINLVTDFKTPQSIFKFNHTEEIVDVVEGDESCMVVFRKDKDSYGLDYYLKSGDEYKSPYIFPTKKVASSVGKYGSCSIDNVRRTNDYYVVGGAIIEDGKNLTVTGNDNQVFQYTAVGDTLVLGNEKNKKTFYFTVHSMILAMIIV